MHIRGSIAFEKGRVDTVNVSEALVPIDEVRDIIDDFIDLPTEEIALLDIPALGADDTEVSFLTIGAANVNAFVGINGPYWTDLDGDRNFSWALPDGTTLTNADGTPMAAVIVDGVTYGDSNSNLKPDVGETAELNANATGLVINDFDFGMALMKPTNPIDFVKYFALKADAEEISLVGMEGVTLSAQRLSVEVNSSTPMAFGIPLTKVVDFASTYESERQALFDFIAGGDGVISVSEFEAAFGADFGVSEAISKVDELVALLDVGGGPPAGTIPDTLLTIDEVIDRLMPSYKTAANEASIRAFDVDGDEKFDPVGYEVNTGSTPVYLAMDSFAVKAEGRVELDILGSLTLSGSLAFELGPKEEVILANGDRKDVTTMTIGGADISAFVGIDGPYWTDVDQNGEVSWSLPELKDGDVKYVSIDGGSFEDYGDINGNKIVDAGETADPYLRSWLLPNISRGQIGRISDHSDGSSSTSYGNLDGDNNPVEANETAELNEDAIGLAITDLDFGIAVMVATSPTDLGVYLAGKLNIPDNGIAFVGVDEFTLSGSLDVEFNLGLGTSGVSPIDFVKSFGGDLAVLSTDGDSLFEVIEDSLHADIEAADLIENGGDGDGIVTQGELLALYDTTGDGLLNVREDTLTDYIISLAGNDDYVNLAGFEVNTGPGGTPVLLDFTGFLIRVQLEGLIEMEDIFRMSGVFLFEIDNQGLKAFANAQLTVAGGEFLNMEAIGVLIINDQGVAADLEVSLSIDVPGLAASASARLLLNTTGAEQGIAIPDQFLDSLSSTALSRLVDQNGASIDTSGGPDNTGDGVVSQEELDTARAASGDLRYVVAAAAPSIGDLLFGDGSASNAEPGFYIAIAFSANLRLGNAFDLSGKFGLIVTEERFDLLIGASISIGPLGNVGASGAIRISSDGLVGRIELTLNVDAVGIKITGDALFEINTTNAPVTLDVLGFDADGKISQTLVSTEIDPGVLIRVEGTLEFVGFIDATASLTIEFDSSKDRFFLGGSAQIELAGGLLSANIGLAVDIDSTGVVLFANVEIEANVAEVIKIKAEGLLKLNTRNSNYTIDDPSLNGYLDDNGISRVIVANSFRLELSGEVSFLEVLKFRGLFTVLIGAGTFDVGSEADGTDDKLNLNKGEWYVGFDVGIDFFGIAELEADGWFSSHGFFDMRLQGELTLGSNSFGLVGQFDFRVYYYQDSQQTSFFWYQRFRVSQNTCIWYNVCFSEHWLRCLCFGYRQGAC